jgi:4-carboxymuconolactone decarboxylase
MNQRIPYPDLNRLSPEQQEVADAVASGPRGQIRGPMLLWLHSPELAARGQRVGEFLRWGTVFDARLSELAILATARHCKGDYVWFNHVGLALEGGLSEDAVEAIKHRRKPVFEREDERVVYDVATQLLTTSTLEDATVEEARALFGDRGIVELTAIVGYYQMGIYTLAAARVPLVDGSWSCLPD